MEIREIRDQLSKQELASMIWDACNEMRTDAGMDASEYKNYIIGLMFYKWLSEQEERYLEKNNFSDFNKLTANNDQIRKFLQENIGYFISKKYLFSTWYDAKEDIKVKDVADGLTDFDRYIYSEYEKQYKGILSDLQNSLDKLGSTPKEQNKSLYKLVKLINQIPTSSDDYDVLGYIYEYLISNFASNAGKKAGEFYTPHEASEIMSRIVANHLKDRDKIKVYDPTSGSASLLMTIGNSFVKEGGKFDNVEYFAQEKNPVTHNLTRINLIMKGISPSNFNTRNNNTLTSDWPYYENNGIKRPVIVDAVVSNPPYSAKWTPIATDPRFGYGSAPKSKADYAFLLHDLYHLDKDGVLAIVLPHGVLFRGKQDDEAEGTIRKNLVENDHIETIIGLPANIFFGTSIPTIIMILKKERKTNDILFVNASKGFEKNGNKNKLRDCDIKRIVDVVTERISVPKFSRLVDKKEIQSNEYNLNIPRYVDISEKPENWDIRGIMEGAIPNYEIDELEEYWDVFPSLKKDLFNKINNDYSELKDNYKEIINSNKDVKKFIDNYNQAFNGFEELLVRELITNIDNLDIIKIEKKIIKSIFDSANNIDLINAYEVFQLENEQWVKTAKDLEKIVKNGKQIINKVAPTYKIKDGEAIEDVTEGVIIPLELVKKYVLIDEYESLQRLIHELEDIYSELETLIAEGDPDTINDITNDSNDKFVPKEVEKKIKEIFEDIEDGEIGVLKGYITLLESKANKKEKLKFIAEHNIGWKKIEASKDGTFSKSNAYNYLKSLYDNYVFEDNSSEQLVIKVNRLLQKEKELKKTIKAANEKLTQKAIDTLKSLPFKDTKNLLKIKWVDPSVELVNQQSSLAIKNLISSINILSNKYKVSLKETEEAIEKQTNDLISMMNELDGDDNDLKGIKEFISLFRRDQ